MPPIKILHIIKSLGRGGAEMLLPETLQLHDQDNFEFHVLYFLPWKDQMVSRIEEAGGKVTCLEAKDNIQLISKYKEVLRYCSTHHIDLVHCHLPWAGFLGRWIYKKTKIPVLYTEHNMQERYHIVTRLINRYTFNAQSMALGVSDDVTRSIEKNIRPKIPVETLLNGVNTHHFVKRGDDRIRAELGIPSKGIVIGNVAVFRFQKRLVEWLKVFKKISEKQEDVYGIIVGAGPLEEEVKKECHRLNLENKVFLPGLQTEVKPYFEAMDIFMMSSQFEGLPIALLEAMSMECAVVATDAGGIKEVVQNGKNGLTCQVDQWEKLEDLCLELIADPVRLQELKSSARKRVERAFSLERMVQELEAYYGQFAGADKLSRVS